MKYKPALNTATKMGLLCWASVSAQRKGVFLIWRILVLKMTILGLKTAISGDIVELFQHHSVARPQAKPENMVIVRKILTVIIFTLILGIAATAYCSETYYEIWRGTTSDISDASRIKAWIQGTSYTDSCYNCTPGQDYYYRVKVITAETIPSEQGSTCSYVRIYQWITCPIAAQRGKESPIKVRVGMSNIGYPVSATGSLTCEIKEDDVIFNDTMDLWTDDTATVYYGDPDELTYDVTWTKDIIIGDYEQSSTAEVFLWSSYPHVWAINSCNLQDRTDNINVALRDFSDDAPSNLQASNDDPDKVLLTWSPSSGNSDLSEPVIGRRTIIQDTTPPSPTPMTWATEPYATGQTSIRMVATTASDVNGVEYYFDETSGNPGADDSEWQESPIYEDTGLQPGTTYTYTVKARDKSPNQNETDPSDPKSASNPPSKATNPSPSNGATDRSIYTDISWSNGGGATSYDVYFGTDPSPDSGEFKGTQMSTTYDPDTLNYNTTYYWRIDAKNSDGTTTGDVWHFTTEGGAISGVVTRDSDGQPIAGLTVSACNYSTMAHFYVKTQADGSYTIKGLAPGSYVVSIAIGADYAREYYDNVYNYNSATPVPVTTGQTTSGINFSLAMGGKITGVVTRDSDDQPIAGLAVFYYSMVYEGNVYTQSDGSYALTGLLPGSYQISVGTYGTDYVSEYYDDVDIALEQTIANMDFSLVIGGKITGVVTRDSDDQPIADLSVRAKDLSTGAYFFGQTESNGSYAITRLPTGSYSVYAYTFGKDYVQEYYDNTYDENSATPVGVTLGQTTSEIDFQLGTTIIVDSDNDELLDALENTSCTDPFDADTDDDGISDGDEDANHNGMVDPGETDPCNPDTDGDGIQDGTELGITEPIADPDGAGPLLGTDTDIFIPDADPTTTTDPLNSDSDGDGLSDGEEDTNYNGMVDLGELDPNHVSGDVDGDGDVDLADAILALQVMAGIEPSSTVHKEADVNGDGKIGIEEVIYILQKISGLRQ